jgi:hypothetical protein
MNKRIKKKVTSTKNMKRQMQILNQIKQHFKISSKRFGNEYFLCYMGEKSVCHFRLKETPQWKYGIWLEDNNGFEIFGEHVDLIDKFKPSRTYVSHKNDVEGFIEEIKNISKNPKLYFVDSLTSGDALVAYDKTECENADVFYHGYQCVSEYNEETKCYDIYRRNETIAQEDFVNKKYNEYLKEKLREWTDENSDKRYAFDLFRELPNKFDNVIAVGVNDINKNGIWSSDRYRIRVVIINGLSQDEFEKFADEVEDFVHKKRRSDDRKTCEHGFIIKDYYEGIGSIADCEYKFYKEKKCK